MYYEILEDLPNKKDWTKIQAIKKGWSYDKKFYIEDEFNNKLLLRLSDINLYEMKKQQFMDIKLIGKLGLNTPRPIEFGICNSGKSVYAIFTWIEGIDLEDAIKSLDLDKQYNLGFQTGYMLKKMHSIEVKNHNSNWEDVYKYKINRVIEAYKRCDYKFENDNSVIAFIKENEKLLINRPILFQHGDYHIGNMILTPNGDLGVIDFNRSSLGDPYEEYDRFVFTWSKSISFANGQLHGYFDGNPPEEFFKLVALYTATNLLSSIPWAVNFGEEEINVALKNTKKIMEVYDNFKTYIPKWYKEKELYSFKK